MTKLIADLFVQYLPVWGIAIFALTAAFMRCYIAIAMEFSTTSRLEQWLVVIAFLNVAMYYFALYYGWLSHDVRIVYSRLVFIWFSSASIYISYKSIKRGRFTK